MTAARQEPVPDPQPMHAAAAPTHDAETPSTGPGTPVPARDEHAAEEPGYGHGV